MSDFARPTRSALITRAKTDLSARLPGADSRPRRSMVAGLAAMHAGAGDGLYGYLDGVADQLFADSCSFANLARKAAVVGITQKPATQAAGSGASTATQAGVIPAGSVFQSSDGVQYANAADLPFIAGAVDVALTAVLAGAAGNQDAGAVLTLTTPVAGLASAFTLDVGGLVGGADAETQAELLARYYQRVRNPPKGGGPGDYVSWALTQPGVTRAWELKQWMGLGTVGLAFAYDDRADIFPTAGDVTAMQSFMDGVAPIFSTVDVFSPASDPINFTIAGSGGDAAVQAAITAELEDFFFREAQPDATTLYRSHYEQAISLASGLNDHTTTVPAGNITPTVGQLPVLGVITWT